MDAEYITNSWPIALKSTLIIPNNFLCSGVNSDSRMLDKILYIVVKS